MIISREERLSNIKVLAKRFIKRENITVPVKILKVIEKFAILESVDMPFTDAICTEVKKKPIVYYNNNISERRLNFTMAHELGHILIPWHTDIISCHTEEDYGNVDEEYEVLEREANTFASELLMPRSWLSEVIASNNGRGVEEIIETVSSLANVSFAAAAIAVKNSLGPDYVIIENNKEFGFTFKRCNKENIFNLREKSENSFEWLTINSVKYGSYELNNSSVRWVILGEDKDELFIKNKFSNLGKEELVKEFKYLFDEKKISPSVNLNKLKNIIPNYFILKVELKNSKFNNLIFPNKCKISNPYSLDTEEQKFIQWYDNKSIGKAIYYHEKFSIIVWEFKKYYVNFQEFKDKRCSKSIMKNIVHNNYLPDRYVKIFSTVNGIVGSLNNKKNGFDEQQFYSALKHKFMGRDDLADIINLEEFDNFLINKTIEIYKIKQ